MPRWIWIATVVWTIVLMQPTAAQTKIQFDRQVRPILSDACFQCHGPDEAKRQGGLRLDAADAAIRGGDSGPAIVAGQPDSSEVWKRVTSTDPDVVMPPPKSGRVLRPNELATLRQWISEGAEYQGHWAFQRVERPDVPAVERVDNPIDAFIRDRLRQDGLQPAPEASRETLIRRVTLDLTGLPPTLDEVDAFLADVSSDAYEKVVDRLLSSPHYGERMAQQWLDFARYADSNGFQVDSSRQMSAWRDWVIRAFNRNVPFDQFTIEQLAGDLLPNPTRDQIVATGFHRNVKLNGEGGRIQEEWFAETVIDRVETTGLTWMAMTMNCCRCHDHKYDPISQKEFYQFFAFFNSVDESGVLEVEGGNTRPVERVPTVEHEQRLAELRQAIPAAETKLAEMKSTSPARQDAWETSFARQLAENPETWRLLVPSDVRSVGGATLTKQADESWLAGGTNPANDEYQIAGPIPPGKLTGLLLEAFPDPSLPNMSLGRYPNGNFVLSDVDAIITAPSLSAPVKAEITQAVSDYDQSGWPVQAIVDGKSNRQGRNSRGWAVDGPTKRENRKAMFLFATPVIVPADATITILLKHDALGGHNIGRFRLSTTSWPGEKVRLDGSLIPEFLRLAVATPKNERSKEQLDEIARHFREQADAEIRQAEQSIAAAKKAVTDYEATIPTVMVMKELATPRDAFLLKRGQYDQPGDKVTRGVPAAFPPLPDDAPVSRLGLAQWLVSREHPLTARVWVNRAWERFFGAGLVRTTENLGSQSEWPSHPELLDWLAAELMEATHLPSVAGQPSAKWDMKALQKLIVMSATYRQDAEVTSDADPENRLLSRGPRVRLSAEMARDQALAISGLLVRKIGGPSVRPYMPDGVWDETSRYGDLRGYKPDAGEGLYRRSLYTIWKRTAPPPSLMLFDAPAREVCTVKRSRTNTPLQALALMNEITYVEAARKLGERMMTEGGDSAEERLIYGFRTATARRPAPAEIAVLLGGLQEDLARFQKHPDAASRYLTVGTSRSPESLDPAELAAWSLTANVLLNLDEVVTRE
ncbi:MAG: PSD1 and planctomycete cytochrome C domain-containing protein [Planctomycetota bacterium]